MKPEILKGLSPQQELDYVRAVWKDFSHSEAHALLMWWLSDLHRDARAIYLAPDVSPTHRLMAIGQEQVLEALHQKMGELFEKPQRLLLPEIEDLELEPAAQSSEDF